MSKTAVQLVLIAAAASILNIPEVNAIADEVVAPLLSIPTQSQISLKIEAIARAKGITFHRGMSLVILRGHGLNGEPLPQGNQYYPPQWNDAFFLVQPGADGKLHVIFSAVGTADPNTAIDSHPDHKQFGGWVRIKSGFYPNSWVSDGTFLLQSGAVEVEVIDREGRASSSQFWDNGTPENPGSFIGHEPMVFDTPPIEGEAVSSQGCLVLKDAKDWRAMLGLIGENKVVQVAIF